MPTDMIIQYGSFGLVVFVVVFTLVWFVRVGFPRTLDALSSMVDRVLLKIDSIEDECREERAAILKAFREEREFERQTQKEIANRMTQALADIYNKRYDERGDNSERREAKDR